MKTHPHPHPHDFQWEVQQFVNGQWVNAIVSIKDGVSTPQQFVTLKEAEDERDALIRDIKDHAPTSSATFFRVNPRPPIYETGHRFNAYVPVLKHRAELILSYSYHNLANWRYHLGLILGPAGSPVPERYKHCRISVMNGEQFVDFTTVSENEVALLKEGKL